MTCKSLIVLSVFLTFSQTSYFKQSKNKTGTPTVSQCHVSKRKLVLSKGRLSKGTAFVLGTGHSAHMCWPFLLTSFVYIHIDPGTALCGRTNKNTNTQARTHTHTRARTRTRTQTAVQTQIRPITGTFPSADDRERERERERKNNFCF